MSVPWRVSQTIESRMAPMKLETRMRVRVKNMVIVR